MMVKAWLTVVVLLGVWAAAQPLSNNVVEAQDSGLSPYFYDATCPQVFEIVADGVWTAIQNETRNAASLLRVHFHDCFVQGCDGSVLLAATATIPSEQTAPPNNNSLRGFQYIYDIKTSLEASCPGVVSCADIVALSAFFSVVFSGGPAFWLPLGRRDSFTAANVSTILAELIAPTATLETVKNKTAFQNLTVTDIVALQGAHTIGIGRCANVIGRIYNFSSPNPGPTADPALNTTLLKTLEANCPFTADPNSPLLNVPNPMDIETPTVFDNRYYQDLLEGNGLFDTDSEMVTSANDTLALVELYASNQEKFFEDFSNAMVSMGKLNVLTGTNGEIRLNCSVRNPVSDVIEEMVNVDLEQKSERTKTVERTESAVEFFKQIVKKVVAEIAGKELEKIIEDTTDWGYSSM